MKYYEEWNCFIIEVDDLGELNISYSMNDSDVTDEHYGWGVEHLREKGVKYND